MTIARGQLIIDTYRRTFEGDDDIMLVQIIGDLLEWCDHNKKDFLATVEEAQDMLRDCGS